MSWFTSLPVGTLSLAVALNTGLLDEVSGEFGAFKQEAYSCADF